MAIETWGTRKNEGIFYTIEFEGTFLDRPKYMAVWHTYIDTLCAKYGSMYPLATQSSYCKLVFIVDLPIKHGDFP
jgi:hypothetical protein